MKRLANLALILAALGIVGLTSKSSPLKPMPETDIEGCAFFGLICVDGGDPHPSPSPQPTPPPKKLTTPGPRS